MTNRLPTFAFNFNLRLYTKDVDITWEKLEGGKSVRITAKWTNAEYWFGVSFPEAGPNLSYHISTRIGSVSYPEAEPHRGSLFRLNGAWSWIMLTM